MSTFWSRADLSYRLLALLLAVVLWLIATGGGHWGSYRTPAERMPDAVGDVWNQLWSRSSPAG